LGLSGLVRCSEPKEAVLGDTGEKEFTAEAAEIYLC